jgi:hypothetical protein
MRPVGVFPRIGAEEIKDNVRGGKFKYDIL